MIKIIYYLLLFVALLQRVVRVILSCHPTIKIIFISGPPDDVVDHHGLPANKVRHLNKPIPMTKLAWTVFCL